MERSNVRLVDWLFYRVMLPHMGDGWTGGLFIANSGRTWKERRIRSSSEKIRIAGSLRAPKRREHSSSRVQTDRLNKRDASYLVLHAFESHSKNSRMREETPTQRHLQLLSALLREEKDDVWSISSDFFLPLSRCTSRSTKL